MDGNSFIIFRLDADLKQKAANKIRKKYRMTLSKFLRLRILELLLDEKLKN